MERRAIVVRGTIQGVGFRPFVFGLASGLGLRGFVRNALGGVEIEVEGEGCLLDEFIARISSEPPAPARIDELKWERRAVLGDEQFCIQESSSDAASGGPVVISADVGTCEDCLGELFDERDRRYRYPFLNCTNCGPRLTIVTGAPYDRERTTMAGFAMCEACRAEYVDPGNRRFHAQPTCCARCGPELCARDSAGNAVEVDDPLKWFAGELQRGRIGAMKGLGGYHLICDATNEAAVVELRRRKHRDEKPFGVMVNELAGVEALCEVNESERELLVSRRRPIVLLGKKVMLVEETGSSAGLRDRRPRRRDALGWLDLVAPGNPRVGVMLPYTPLHYLLMGEMGGRPLVMTSGNRSDEPIAYQEPDVFQRLAGIADVFLTHNRAIRVRCDDSVTRVVGGRESPIRRSRGYAPQPINLPFNCERAILAVGGQLKNTFAIGRGRQAVVSHHNGDLDHFGAYQAFGNDVRLYEQLFESKTSVIAHDLHPDYSSTRFAVEHAKTNGCEIIAVQHHHAHMASCMAERGLNEKVIGVTFDGTGFGTDGAVWGGEFLIGDFCGFHRAGHLRYVCMPGSDQAIREPWRMAVSYLSDAGCQLDLYGERLPSVALKAVGQMIRRGFNSPMTSSAGRLFDAIASIAGVRDRVSYEGQAAMELEWLAEGISEAGVYPFEISAAGEGPMVIDTRPLVASVLADASKKIQPAVVARRFHSTIVSMIDAVCRRIRETIGLNTVVLSGGVFMNALLSNETFNQLTSSGFHVFCHQLVPPNDGGLSLGQLAVAAAGMNTDGGSHVSGNSR